MKATLATRVVSFIIAALMLVCVFASCSNQNDDTAETTPQAIDTTPTEDTMPSNVDAKGYLLDDIPDELDYGGKTITLLYWSDVEHEEFFVEEQTGNNVDDAFYNRQLTIEDRLGIDMQFIGQVGNSDNNSKWVQRVQTALQAGNDEFDAMGGYSLSVAACANKGYLADLLQDDCQYLNFDQPWWPSRLITEATINNKLYFASGDISANALYMMYVCYVNNTIHEEMGLPNMFDLVNNGQWTYTKFIELCSNVYIDQDGDGTKTVGDRFGYMSSGIHVDPWFYGSGALIVDKDAEGNPKPADSFGGEKVIKTIDMINNLFWDSNDGIYTSSVKHQGQFNEGNLLFMTERARISFKELKNDDLKFSIIPCPKYDEAQESYVTVMGNPFTLYAIPVDATVEELPMLSAYIETYASESYRQVTPEVFEISLKIKYTQDEESAIMYDTIRENLTFDLGRIFSAVLVGQGAFRNQLSGNQNTWASTIKGYSKTLPKMLNKLVSAYAD